MVVSDDSENEESIPKCIEETKEIDKEEEVLFNTEENTENFQETKEEKDEIKEEIQEEIDTTEKIIKEKNEEENQEEITCYTPLILTDTDEKKENIEDKAEEVTEKENFEKITENQYQLFNTDVSEIIDEAPEIVEAEGKEEETIQEKVIEPVEEIKTEPEISEVYEPKTVTIDYNNSMGKLETALEIRYSSLKLTSFPIKISNIPEGMTFPDELNIGNASIKIGEEVINNCYLKVLSNESVKMFEIKHREFKLGLSVTLNNDTINSYGSVRYYEISSLIKTSRIIKVLEMLENIFEGAPITFKVNKLYGNIIAEDRIENMRVKTALNFFNILENAKYKFQSDRLPKSENIFYLLELSAALRENKAIETWCNFSLNIENTDINKGDSIVMKRIHNLDKHSAIEETITLKNPLDEQNIFKEKTAGYRKQCVIELKKINI